MILKSPSIEQSALIYTKVHRVLAQAFAGTGKTFSLEAFVRANQGSRVLMLVYSKALQKEARKRFPANVDCFTTHALAGEVKKVYDLAGKFGEVKPLDLVSLFGLQIEFARVLLTTVEQFLHSGDDDFVEDHVPVTIAAKDVPAVIEYAKQVWRVMSDPADGRLKMTHDGYLKKFQLSKPDLSKSYDIILVDEWQDANPVTVALVDAQSCRLVLVGDEFQGIFAFRGAADAMRQIEVDQRLAITESRRFGPAIAGIATVMLQHYLSSEKALVSATPEKVTSFELDYRKPFAIISRTNAKLFEAATRLLDKRLHFVGGLEAYPFEQLLDMYRLSRGLGGVQDKLLKHLRTVEAVQRYASTANDLGLSALLSVVNAYGDALPGLIAQMKAAHVENSCDAEVQLLTAHRSKGLEFDQVHLLSDFANFVSASGKPVTLVEREDIQELHLLYVALTRARNAIQLNTQICRILSVLDPANRLQLPKGHDKQRDFLYSPDIDACSVLNSSKRGLSTHVIPQVSADDLAMTVQRLILRKGLLRVSDLASAAGVEQGRITKVVLDMVADGRLSAKLFDACPVMALALRKRA